MPHGGDTTFTHVTLSSTDTIRLTNDPDKRVKRLSKEKDIKFIPLPKPMNRADAMAWFGTHHGKSFPAARVKAALAKAAPKEKPAKGTNGRKTKAEKPEKAAPKAKASKAKKPTKPARRSKKAEKPAEPQEQVQQEVQVEEQPEAAAALTE